MELSTSQEREEAVLTESDNEEADNNFYFKRLMMVTTAKQFGSSSPHVTEISPQIGVLKDRVNNQIYDKLLNNSMSQTDLTEVDEKLVKMEHLKESVGPAVGTHTGTANFRKTRAVSVKCRQPHSSPQPKPAESPKHLSLHGLSQSGCSTHMGPLKRSVRSKVMTHGQTSKGEQQREKSIVIKDQGGNAEHRVRQNRKGLSTKKMEVVKSVVLPHSSTRSQQRPKAGHYSNPGFRRLTPKTGKMNVSRIHRRNQFGETLLHVAVMKGDLQSVKNMIKVGACVNLADNAGWTALHEAVLSNHYTIAEALLKAGAHINPVGHEGVTPLHDAVVLGNLKIIDLLLKHGADPLLKNGNGDSAIDISNDATVQKLLGIYVPKTKRNLSSVPVPQSVSSTSSFVENRTDRPGRKSCRRARQSAPLGEAGNNLQSNETEPPGDPGTGGTVKVHELSTASPKGVVGEIVKESANTINEMCHLFQSCISDANETNERQCKDSWSSDKATKRGLDGAGDDHETNFMNDSNSTVTSKKMRRIPMASKENDFLDYLLNFDLQCVSLPDNGQSASLTKGESDCPAFPVNNKVDHVGHDSGPAFCQRGAFFEDMCASHTQSNLHKECSISVDTPCLNETVESNSERQYLVDVIVQPVTYSPVHVEESLELTGSESPSLLIGVVHDQGLTCSPEPLVREGPLGKLKTTSEQLKITDLSSPTSSKSDIVQSCFDQGQEKQKYLPLTCFDNDISTDALRSLTNREMVTDSERGGASNVLTFSKVHSYETLLCGQTDTHIKQIHQEEENKETQIGFSLLLGSNGTQDLETCARNNTHMEDEESDSDCTVVEELEQQKTSGRVREDVTIRNDLNTAPAVSTLEGQRCIVQNDSCRFPESGNCGEKTEDTVHPQHMEILPVSRPIDVPLEPLCLVSELDNNQDTDRVGQDDCQIVENVEVLHTSTLSQCIKKTRSRKHKLSKQTRSVDMLNAAVKPKSTLKISQRSLHKRNGLGETSLHKACKKGDLPLAKSLIEAGISVNVSDNAGWTALHEASAAGYLDVVEVLLHAGANVTSRGLEGFTPLHDAVSSGQYEVAKLLLHYGANPHDKNALGQNALDLAVHDGIKELLSSFKGPLLPERSTESPKQGSQMLSSEQIQKDKKVYRKPRACFCCQEDMERPMRNTQEYNASCKENSFQFEPGQSQTIKLTLQVLEQKQTELSDRKLTDPEDCERFTDALSEMHNVLNEIFLKQQAEKNDFIKTYRTASHSFSQSKLRELLTDLASRQKSLLAVLQKQNELKHKVNVFKDQLPAQSLPIPEPSCSLICSMGTLVLNSTEHRKSCTDLDERIIYEHSSSTHVPTKTYSFVSEPKSLPELTKCTDVSEAHYRKTETVLTGSTSTSSVTTIPMIAAIPSHYSRHALKKHQAPLPAHQTGFLVIDSNDVTENPGMESCKTPVEITPELTFLQQVKVHKTTGTTKKASNRTREHAKMGKTRRGKRCGALSLQESNTAASGCRANITNSRAAAPGGVIETPGVISNTAYPSERSEWAGAVCDDSTLSRLINKGIVQPGERALEVMYKSRPQRDHSVNAGLNVEKGPQQLQECALKPTSVGYPEDRMSGRFEEANKTFLDISTVQLISDKEFLPCSMMDRYWDVFIHSEDWVF